MQTDGVLADLAGYHSPEFYTRYGIVGAQIIRRAVKAGELKHLRVGQGDPRGSKLLVHEVEFRRWVGEQLEHGGGGAADAIGRAK